MCSLVSRRIVVSLAFVGEQMTGVNISVEKTTYPAKKINGLVNAELERVKDGHRVRVGGPVKRPVSTTEKTVMSGRIYDIVPLGKRGGIRLFVVNS